MSKKPDTRSLEIALEIDAPPEHVWRALTDVNELTSWFPLAAEVSPGKGGKIVLKWSKDLHGNCPIQTWEPNRHLRTGWMDTGDALHYEAAPLASIVDYFIESAGGKTVLRLVHSGIGAGKEWDEEYESVSRGWAIELRNLKHYLEKHRGKRRRVAWARQPISISIDEAWKRLEGPSGAITSGSIHNAGVGQAYEVRLASGDALNGVVTVHNPPRDFVGTVKNMGDSVFRVSIETCFATPEVGFWLSSWELPEDEVQRIQERWSKSLKEVFAAAA